MKALVLCGGKPQIALIHELKRRNITAILADANDKAAAVQYADVFYNVSTLDVVGIEKIALAEKVDCILSVCADQMLLVAAQLSEKLNLPCYIDYETAKNVSSKEYMKRIFVENNIPTAKYIVGSSISLSVIEGLNFPLMAVLDPYILDEVGEKAENGFYSGAEIYGIGTSIKAFSLLDAGKIQCLIVPDLYEVGYESMNEIASKLKNSWYQMESHETEIQVVYKKDLFSEDIERFLYSYE